MKKKKSIIYTDLQKKVIRKAQADIKKAIKSVIDAGMEVSFDEEIDQLLAVPMGIVTLEDTKGYFREVMDTGEIFPEGLYGIEGFDEDVSDKVDMKNYLTSDESNHYDFIENLLEGSIINIAGKWKQYAFLPLLEQE